MQRIVKFNLGCSFLPKIIVPKRISVITKQPSLRENFATITNVKEFIKFNDCTTKPNIEQNIWEYFA